jgi:Spy/CpxP family protein refolding chaperone
MFRHFAWVFLVAFLGSTGATAAPLCEQQRGDGRKPDAAQQEEGPPRWKWWLHPETRKELRLTDQQSKKINEVWESTAPTLREKWHELERLEDGLAATIKAYSADQSIVAQQVEKVEKLRAENNATRTVMIYRMQLLLNPEQRVKVDEMRARMDAERKQRQDEERKRQGRGDKNKD